MAFDFTTTPTDSAAISAALDLGSLADRRRALLALHGDAGPDTDWRALCDALASVMPKPKATPAAADASGEWCEYTDAQCRGKGAAFHPGREAVFRFADGETIRVQLGHRVSKPLPDWERAARCAVSFYRARRARNFMRMAEPETERRYSLRRSWAEEYADSCAVPAIVEGLDVTRGTFVDVAEANAVTEADRDGPRYLAELVGYACAAGGCWKTAWGMARTDATEASNRDEKARAIAEGREMNSKIAAQYAA